MDASVGEPFLLASYAVPQRLQNSRTAKESPRASIFATHGKTASGSSDGYVTVSAQGDGVHVLDLSTLHPIISHTLGPSTSFACPSVSLSIQEGQQNVFATYSAIASSAEVTSEDCGRTIWLWRENLSSTLGDRPSQKKRAVTIPHPISEIYPCNDLSPRLLVMSPAGDITVLDANLKIQTIVIPPPDSVSLLQSFIFHRGSASFLPESLGSTSVVLLEHSEDAKTRIRIVAFTSDAEGREIGSSRIPVKPDEIICASCSSSGFLSILTRKGSWSSFQIETKPGLSVYPAAQPLELKSLSFIGKSLEASVVALNTSLVLLAAVTSSPRNVVLLLWDLQYSVLLASHVLSIPSTLSHLSEFSITLSLLETTSRQAILILSPPTADAPAKSATRSSILVVPLGVPSMSSISNAMGRALSGAQWLVQPSANDALGPARVKVLTAIQTAMANGEAQAAEKAFETRTSLPAFTSLMQRCVPLGHSFVRGILVAVLLPAKPSSAPYSSALVRFLLERRVVSASMIEGGLLAALKLRGDWNAIELCTTTVVDLAEADLMSILQFVAEHSRKIVVDDSMDVDPPALGAVPKLPAFLNACVLYQTAPSMLRAAIHQHLTQPEDLVAVLEVLDKWMLAWRGAEVIALPSKKSVVKNEHGIIVLKDGWQKKDDALPPLINVLFFLQAILDASFLALLQHAPAHRVLRKVLSRIEPEIQLTEQVELLRGPLELFARAQARALRDGKEGPKEASDWRQRRRMAHERSAMAVGGLYQLDELLL
ncbi:hypothetical protein B0H15DRAFT_930478 [Mycena belliarum]|uniref:Uncharacterized protein n=1 Tax=Mycena belliarum TaxID=1033014 RepID=A0AAD6XRP9_9AGAR|nr:hypothetical protein B0H15DRAFT_930478 [Mycena belliae]